MTPAASPPASARGTRQAAAPPAGAPSLAALLRDRFADSHDRPALVDGLRPDMRLSWGETITAALTLATRLEAEGLSAGDRLAHVGPPSPDWVLVDLACLLSGVVHVALHADATPAEHARQLAWLQPRAVVVSGAGQAPAAGRIPLVRLACPAVPLGPDHDRAAISTALDRRVAAVDPAAPATILLSSGTTGHPHGVVHCQRALVANATAAAAVFLDEPDDVRLAWLPQSHALARTGDLYTALVRGGCLSLVGDRRRILDACRALPPTVILGVPAFFMRLERASAAGRIADLKAALGGRVRVAVSGGAALPERTAAWFSARGVPLVEGYGLAEAGPVVTLASPRSLRPGTVGQPLAGVELRLDPQGQLLVRTPSRAIAVIAADNTGAHQAGSSPEPTEPAEPTAHDWLATGDTATIDPDGHVRITGRVVETLVLATGHKLPPAAVERALAEEPLVAQVCVVGQGLPWPVALVVPDPDRLRLLIRSLGARVVSRRGAAAHPRVLGWLARRLDHAQRWLPRAWRARRAVLVMRAFDAAHDEATESFKLKREAIARHFRTSIEAAVATPAGRGVIVLPPSAPSNAPPAARGCAVAALWGGAPTADGFAAAADATSGDGDRHGPVVTAALEAITRLRAAGALHEPGPVPPPAPLADDFAAALLPGPPPASGVFSTVAEEAVGETGLWGLAVPEDHGGSGANLRELAAAITRVAAAAPTAAGMLAVHSSIGAVSALTAFGTPQQQARHLPGLARGRPLSVFGATEPGAGCDLHAASTRLERTADGHYVVTGTKLFITGATHGRLVKLLAQRDGRPAVALVGLPAHDGPGFRLRHYRLHPLRHAHNAALEFARMPVSADDLLAAPGDDGMAIVWHGLNRGRVTLCAQAAGTLRILLAHATDHARRRQTWGRPIASRELVLGRLGRIAAAIPACDALAAWAGWVIDAGLPGELEAIVAKTTASLAVRDAAFDALGVHGGRAFLVGHPLGDALHDHLAVTVYEGESDLLGLALFKGLSRGHPLAGRRDAPAWRRAATWLAWRTAALVPRARARHGTLFDRRLAGHAAAARRLLDQTALAIDRAIRRHGRGLAERQLEIGGLAAIVRDGLGVLAVAHHADRLADERGLLGADVWCRLALARARGRRLTAADLDAVATLGRAVVADAHTAN
jgi:long-subunit acyl-CoA synthetase (AMP-forming)/alkylation response protein AidB-like acyl-CoA dehydrogenase